MEGLIITAMAGLVFIIPFGCFVMTLFDDFGPEVGLTVLGIAAWIITQVALLVVFGSTILSWTPTLLISQALLVRFIMKGVRELMILSNQNSRDEKQLGKIELSDY